MVFVRIVQNNCIQNILILQSAIPTLYASVIVICKHSCEKNRFLRLVRDLKRILSYAKFIEKEFENASE